jgi:hypothetical protein
MTGEQRLQELPHRPVDSLGFRHEIRHEALITTSLECLAGLQTVFLGPDLHSGNRGDNRPKLTGMLAPNEDVRMRGKQSLQQSASAPLPCRKN